MTLVLCCSQLLKVRSLKVRKSERQLTIRLYSDRT